MSDDVATQIAEAERRGSDRFAPSRAPVPPVLIAGLAASESI